MLSAHSDIDQRDLQRINRFIRRVVVTKKAHKIPPKDYIQALLNTEKKVELDYVEQCRIYREDIRPTEIADLQNAITKIKQKYPTTELSKETNTQINTLIEQISEVGPDIILKKEYAELIDTLINENTNEYLNTDSETITNVNANPAVLEIAKAINSTWQALLTRLIDIDKIDDQIKNFTPQVEIDMSSDGYNQLVDFLKNEKHILPLVGGSASEIIGDHEFSDLDDYFQLLNIINSNITIADSVSSKDAIAIPTFDLKKASRQWITSNRKLAETKSNSERANRPENWGLKEKVLRGISTRNHLLRDTEILSVIAAYGLRDQIHISITNENSISEKLNIAMKNAGEERPDSFHLILSNAKNNSQNGGHWTSAKITVNADHVAIEYADSASFSLGSGYPDELINAVENTFLLEARVSDQKDAIKQPNSWGCGYLALFNCIRHIAPATPIGVWSNVVKNIPLLRDLIQEIVLQNLRLNKDEVNVSVCETDGDKYKFNAAFIDDLFALKNVDSPLYQLTGACSNELEDYITDRYDSWAYDFDPDSYKDRVIIAGTLIKRFKACTSNTDLREISSLVKKNISLLKVTDPSSKLISILESISKKISGRLNSDYEDVVNDYKNDAAQEFFNKIHNLLRTVNAAEHKVAPDKYTWHGQEWLIRVDFRIDERHHNLKDQLFGKLHFIMNDEDMDHPTKITEMRIILAQTISAVTPVFGNGSNFYKTLLYLDQKLNTPANLPPKFTSRKSCSSKPAPIKDARSSLLIIESSFPSEYRVIWNSVKADPVESIFRLLEDYSKADSWALFFSLDWKANNAIMVRTALKHFREKITNGETVTPQEILDHFSRQLNWEETNPCGKLIRRLRYAAVKTNSEFYVCLKKPAAKSLKAG